MADDKSIRVLVLYKDPIVAAGLRSALDGQPDVMLVDRAGRIIGAGNVVECAADVVIADYDRGLELLAGIHAVSMSGGAIAPRILILTNRDSESEIRHALESGARGYLALGCEFDELAAALRALHRGVRCMGAIAASRLADSVASELLTGRELDVLRLLVEGHANKSIARHLNIAPGTVKSHVKGIFQKLGARSRTQVATVAERRGLLALGVRAVAICAR